MASVFVALMLTVGLVSAQDQRVPPDLSGLPKAAAAVRDEVCPKQKEQKLICEVKYGEVIELAEQFLAAHQKVEKLRGTQDRESFQKAFDEAKGLLFEHVRKKALLDRLYPLTR
jgi:hypothetical protein